MSAKRNPCSIAGPAAPVVFGGIWMKMALSNGMKSRGRSGERGSIEGLPLQLLIMIVIAAVGLGILLAWLNSVDDVQTIGNVMGLIDHGVIRTIQVAPLDYQNFEGVYTMSNLDIKVYDAENNPLQGATVTISGAGTHGTQITNEDGTAKFAEEVDVVLPVGVQSGNVLIQVSKSGYGTANSQIPVTRAETAGIEYAQA